MGKQVKSAKSILRQKHRLEKQIIGCMQTMIQGSLVSRYTRCGNKECRCHTKNIKHGPRFFLSVPGKMTYPHYLRPELAKLSLINPKLTAFKKFWELGKQLAGLNLTLYKTSQPRKTKKEKN